MTFTVCSQISFHANEANDEKVVPGGGGVFQGDPVLIHEGDLKSIDGLDRVDVLGDDWVVVFEENDLVGAVCGGVRDEAGEGMSHLGHRLLLIQSLERSVVEERVEFFDGHVTVFGRVGVNVCGDESGLNDVLQRSLEMTREGVRTGLSDAVQSDGVIFILKIRSRGLGCSHESHYTLQLHNLFVHDFVRRRLANPLLVATQATRDTASAVGTTLLMTRSAFDVLLEVPERPFEVLFDDDGCPDVAAGHGTETEDRDDQDGNPSERPAVRVVEFDHWYHESILFFRKVR